MWQIFCEFIAQKSAVMNICLIRPPKLMVRGTSAPQPTPPLGLAYIAGVLLEAKHKVTVIDAMLEAPKQINEIDIPYDSDKMPVGHGLVTLGLTPEQVLKRIPVDTEVVGFSCMFTNNWLADRHLLIYLGQHLPGVTFIAGGESITALAEICLKQTPPLKACVLGEGEETVLELIQAIEKKQPLSLVKGIAYREGDEVFKTERRVRLRNLEQLPYPAWELFGSLNYEQLKTSDDAAPRNTLSLLATRGCPYSCTFCTSPDMWGTRYYMRSPVHVADEVEHLKNKFGITNFDFYDLTAIIKKEWIIEFAQIIIARKLDITWRIPAGTRSEAIDDEVAENLYKSGCWYITYAPESGSPRMLKLIKKKVIIPNMLKSMRQTRSKNMRIYINMIMALPDETHLDIWKTLWFLVQCSWVGVTDMGLFIFRAYPGSALFDRMVAEGKITLNNDDFFLDTIFIIETMWQNSFYNQRVSKSWYRFYHLFAIIVFHGTNFLFRPSRLYHSLKNVILNEPNTAFESRVSFFFKNLFNFEKRGGAYSKA